MYPILQPLSTQSKEGGIAVMMSLSHIIADSALAWTKGITWAKAAMELHGMYVMFHQTCFDLMRRRGLWPFYHLQDLQEVWNWQDGMELPCCAAVGTLHAAGIDGPRTWLTAKPTPQYSR